MLVCLVISSRIRIENFESSERVCIVGCAKNISNHIRKSLDKLIEIKQLFHPESKIIIAENDSTDGTKEILDNYKHNIDVINYDGKVTMDHRTEKLAFLRNELINHVHKKYSHYNYIIIADLDNVIHDLNVQQFQHILQNWKNREWDALFSNSNPYYDIWALRSKDIGIDYDCWDAVHHDGDTRKHVKKFQKNITFDSDAVEVDSAFNGFGIYKLASTKGCSYNGLTQNCSLNMSSPCRKDTCEHVSFHNCLKQNGAKLFILRDLMVKSQEEHI